MTIGNYLAVTNIKYQDSADNDNFAFQGHYETTTPDACYQGPCTPGTYPVTIDLAGSAQATSYNLTYQESDGDGGTDGVSAEVPLTWLDPAYGLETSTTDPDGEPPPGPSSSARAPSPPPKPASCPSTRSSAAAPPSYAYSFGNPLTGGDLTGQAGCLYSNGYYVGCTSSFANLFGVVQSGI